MRPIAPFFLTAVLAVAVAPAERPPSAGVAVLIADSARGDQRFAAREVQRYVYLRTGILPSLSSSPPSSAQLVISVRKAPAAELPAQDYRIDSSTGPAGIVRLAIVGGGDAGVLYGAYRFAELLGARFYLHGDVVPDERGPLRLGAIHERGHPLFSVRGIQPFHDFSEGPDWWNADDYLQIVGQLAKLRMNFIGLHTYPEGDLPGEPTVWIGLDRDIGPDGHVTAAPPSAYHTTQRGGNYWASYAAVPTSRFLAGAGNLYDRDDYGADAMRCEGGEKDSPAARNPAVYNRAADVLKLGFAEAHRLQILTCIGTETPLSIPRSVRAELTASGQNPDDPAVAEELYRAMFRRISLASPVDYYWLWTPEGWTWEGNKTEDIAKTSRDIKAALAALRDLHSSIQLATCGWVLGPIQDRAALDRILPANSPMSAINADDGNGAVERQFANLSNRPRWAIPWLENDPALTAPELFASRMRFDAADALRLGATGLMGLHWRTHLIAPTVAALAAAGWDQSWTPPDFDRRRIPPQTASGAVGGGPVKGDVAPDALARLAPDAAVIAQTNRVGMSRYDLLIPKGDYTVTLGFCELEHKRPGERVFSVKAGGKLLIEHLDLAARFGPNQPGQFTFHQVSDPDGHLVIEFIPHTGQPAIASISVDKSRQINCGGPACGDYEADDLPGSARPGSDRRMPIEDFYRDFAAANFGPGPAPAIARLFSQIDSRLPLPSIWVSGPGDILRNLEPWSRASADYAFVSQFEALRSRVRGAANLDRYDYWLNQFRAMRVLAETGCTAGALDETMHRLETIADPARRRSAAEQSALPLRRHLAELWTQLLRLEIAGVTTNGEMGTIANLEQRTRTNYNYLGSHDQALVAALGGDALTGMEPKHTFAGDPRIVVPTIRTCASAGEAIKLKVLLIAQNAPAGAVLAWRPVGEAAYRRTALRSVARWVYQVNLPPVDYAHPIIEYHLEAKLDGQNLRWPVSDRGQDQTVILAD